MHIAMLFKVFTKNQIKNENLLLIVNKKTFTKKETYLQHKVFAKSMLHTVQSGSYSIGIPGFKQRNKSIEKVNIHNFISKVLVSTCKMTVTFILLNLISKKQSLIFNAYISKTHPKALSVSGSSFIFKETFIHVGAIFSNIS